MSNYHILPLNVENDFIWCVIENKTEQLIRAFAFEDEAEDYWEFLEDGGAFAGFTPSFILQEVAVPINVNHEFADFISEQQDGQKRLETGLERGWCDYMSALDPSPTASYRFWNQTQ